MENTAPTSSQRLCRIHWEKIEDEKLVNLVEKYGEGRWSILANELPGRSGKACSERWHNILNPNIKRTSLWSEEEENIIIEQYEKIGKKWSEIAKFLSGRTGYAIKNHWNSTLRKVHSGKRITRPNESTLLEDYMRNKFSDASSCPSSSSTAAAPINNIIPSSSTVAAPINTIPSSSSTAAAPVNTATITLKDGVIGNQLGYSYDPHEEQMNFLRKLYWSSANCNSSTENAAN